MPRSKTKSKRPSAVGPGTTADRDQAKRVTELSTEQWTTVQVASFLGIPYQKARDNMLAADYGPSDYIAKTRTLLVSASAVRAWKEKHGRKRKRSRTRRTRS